MRVFWFEVLHPFRHALQLPSSVRDVPFLVRLALAFVVTDFLIYWIHRGMHEIPGMWRAHSWHHSSTNLGFFNGFRASFVHVVLLGFAQVISPLFLFHFSPVEMGWYAVMAVFIQFAGHANINFHALRFPAITHQIFATSITHRIHHSRDRMLQDSNYGSVTTLWDRLFGTFTNPRVIADSYPLGAPSDGRSLARELIGF
jgi:sterol desaturase/sphingolipid hydroxylase (fatty acid hydroxylase superfamily)